MAEVNISIIIPTYNVAPYIRKCLESVAAQTFTGSMECLIVDDCGSDNSIQLAEEFIIEYSGPIDFQIIHHEYNKGLSAARNTGIRNATGDYLYFLDSDDWIYPNCIEVMYKKVMEYPDVQCVFAGADVDEGYEFMDYTKKVLPKYANNPQWIKSAMLNGFFLSMTAWNRLIRRDMILKNKAFFVEGIIHEDEVWNVLLSHYIHCAGFCLCNTYYYRLRKTGIIGSSMDSSNRSEFESFTPAINEMIKLIDPQYSDVYGRGLFMFILQKKHNDKDIKEHREYLRSLRSTIKYMNFFHQLVAYINLIMPQCVYRHIYVRKILLHCLWVCTKGLKAVHGNLLI